MPPSRSATIIFTIAAVLLTYILWIALYRGLRMDLLRLRLETLRDRVFDAAIGDPMLVSDPLWQPTVTWIEILVAHASLFTPARFVMVCLCRRFSPSTFDRMAGSSVPVLEPFGLETDALIRHHLVLGFMPLWAWFKREGVGETNRRVIRALIACGIGRSFSLTLR